MLHKQNLGIDYFYLFAPVSRLDAIYLNIPLSTQNKWKIHQTNVKSAFLNDTLEEEVHVQQPVDYVTIEKNLFIIYKI